MAMADKPAPDTKRRPTTMVPVTTMEEVPLLTEQELAELRASLKEAESRIAAGEGIDYDPKTFKKRLITHRNARR
jgi:hypothetical protein